MSNDDDAESGADPRRGPPSPPGVDKTVPRVELALQELSVSVTGRSDDDLDAVEESARELMQYLVTEIDELEEDHDEYGLS
ncbi:MAG: hypothetical protein ABEH90_07380 [Halolamina sp.]